MSEANLRIVTVGFESTTARPLRAALESMSERVDWTRFSRSDITETPDRLAAAFGAADLLLLAGISDTAPVDALAQLLDRHLGVPMVPVVPNAEEITRRVRLGEFDQHAVTALAAAAGTAARAGLAVAPTVVEVLRVLPDIGAELPPEAGELRTLARVATAFRHVSGRNVELALRAVLHTLRPAQWPPVQWPTQHPRGGFWHPRLGVHSTWDSFEPGLREHWGERERHGRVVFLTYPAHTDPDNRAHVQALLDALESRGIEVVGWLGNVESLGDPTVVTGVPGVDAWVNFTALTLSGPHGAPRAPFDIELLAELDTPLFAPIPLYRQTVGEWEPDRIGLSPAEMAFQLSIPELEGAAAQLVVAGRDDASDALVPVAGNVDRFAATVARTVALRRRDNADKRLAIVIFGYHAEHGNVGTASHLDVFASLHRFLLRLQDAGYRVEVPATAEALLDLIVTDAGGGVHSQLAVAHHYHAADYTRDLGRHLDRIAPVWGRAPGEVDTDGVTIDIHGVELGNVFVGVQPGFHSDEDPLSTLFSEDASPSHSFAAFYTWLHRYRRPHAMVHFGTHGTLEFQPGKQAGLTPDDWSSLLTDSVPHFYLYCMDNPSEGTIAKRRSAATLATYLTPPLDRAGLYGTLSALAEDVAGALGEPDPQRQAELVESIRDSAQEANLTVAGDDPVALLRAVQDALDEVERTLIPIGLHVVDRGIDPAEAGAILRAACDYERPEHELPSLTETFEAEFTAGTPITDLPADDAGRARVETELAAVVEGRSDRDEEVVHGWTEFLRELGEVLTSNDEAGALLHALDGGYLRPSPGGNPERDRAALPTGRNMHALDPHRVPTPAAWRRGQRTVETLLAQEDPPETVALVLWGIDNVKSGGEAIAQAFALLGVRPVADGIGRMSRFEVIPPAQLGRPRVDVVCTVSGVFRDLFGPTIDLIDRAVRAVAELDEPDNWVRIHAVAQAAELGVTVAEAASRVFSTAPGQYGAGLGHVIDASQWDSARDLAEVYVGRMSHLYGGGLTGAQNTTLMRRLLSTVSITFHNRGSVQSSLADSDDYFEFLGGLTAAVTAERGQAPRAVIAESFAARPQVRELSAAMDLESRTRLLNPRWYEGQLKHGYQGVSAITKRLENTFGMQATTGTVSNWVFSAAAATFLFDEEMRQRLEKLNPGAVRRFAQRLDEARRREMWAATAEETQRLAELTDHLEDLWEGVS